jgi:probable phosphoglycerate mutase
MPTPGGESAAAAGRPTLWLCRHGETEWSHAGRHTGTTDVGLTPAGRMQAQRAGAVLRGVDFGLVLCSPMARARQTAELAGFPQAIVEPDATEWAYGDYEGLTTGQVRERDPGWTIWRGVTPGGETAAEVGARADRVVARVCGAGVAWVLLISHGHFLRAVGARWLGLPVAWGERLKLGTATLCELGWEREAPAVEQWNVRPRL